MNDMSDKTLKQIYESIDSGTKWNLIVVKNGKKSVVIKNQPAVVKSKTFSRTTKNQE